MDKKTTAQVKQLTQDDPASCKWQELRKHEHNHISNPNKDYFKQTSYEQEDGLMLSNIEAHMFS